MKAFLIILSAVVGLAIAAVFSVNSYRNSAINFEENVNTAKADIDTHIQRRVNLLTELANCVKRYDKHEANTLDRVISSRGKQMSNKEAKEVMLQIAAVAERYPELQSQRNYNILMNECSVTENLVAQHKKAFNSTVREYRRYCRSFPANVILKMLGYEMLEFEYYNTEESDKKPLKLF